MESLSLMFICLGGMACEVRVHGSCFWLLELTDGKTVTPDDMFRGMCFPTEVEEPYSLSHGYLRMVLFTGHCLPLLVLMSPRWSRSSCGTALFRCEPEKSPRSLQLSSVVTRPMYGPSVFYDDLSDDLYGHPWTSFLVQFSFSSP